MADELEKSEVYEQDYVDFVNNEFRKRQSERNPYELQWRLNTEFIRGNQFLNINPQLKRIDEVPQLYWWQEREVFNQMATIIETRVSRLTRQAPKMKSRPSSSSNEDFQRALITTAILNMKYHDEKMEKKYNDMVMWAEHTGTVFLMNTWDSEKGRKVATVETVEMVEEEGIQIPVPKPMDIYEGDLNADVVPSYEIYPDSCGRNNLEEVRSLIRAKAYHIDEIYDVHGVKVEAEQIDSFGMKSSNSIGGLTYASSTFRTANRSLEKHALVKEYYERPSRKHPNGRLIIVAGDKLLHEGELPYAIGEDGKRDFPFVMIRSITIPNQFFGTCVAERCIPIQRRYNALRNRKAEYLNLVSIGQWYEPEGAVNDDDDLNNAPGSIIRYQPGVGRPEPVQFPNLPGSFESEEGTLLAEFTSISGVSELARYSQAPSGVKSGVALSIANEQDDTRIAMTATQLAEGMKETGIQWLRLYQQFVQEPRILRTVGDDLDVQLWTVSDLKADDIIIENESALAETPAQRRQMVFDLIGIGLFNRPESNPFSAEGVQRILDLLEFGHWESGIDEESELHRKKARRENMQFKQGGFAPPSHYDNHELHIMEHNLFRLTPEFEQLQMSPQGQLIAQALDYHITEHAQIVAQQQQQMMLQQMAMQGQQPQPVQ